jgi:uncharacterized membrane protein (DUF2068 family)
VNSRPGKNGTLARSRGMNFALGVFKILQSLLLLGMALGVLRLLNKSADREVSLWLSSLSLDLDSPWIQRLLDWLRHSDDHQLKRLSLGGFIYSALLLTEGTGLCLQKRWGEYFTIVVTGSFLPFEVYECFHGFRGFKLLVFLLNAAILIYLILRVRKEAEEDATPH